ncbi:MAG TPA: neutral zinc metallopeptidase [Longimicrobiaceae bacterium]|nr:neutral zinc metallopeptidase [Longimicrobiaceae bacterium]
MRFGSGRQSGNVEDRRGMGGLAVGGGLGGLLLLLLGGLFGVDLGGLQGGGTAEPPGGAAPADSTDPEAVWVRQMLATTEDTWNAIFTQAGQDYQEPRLRLFTNVVQSGCGTASAQVGPFYCPLDQRVYIDLGFFRELQERFGAPGDFARAYVVAHEVGHHVQTLTGVSQQVQQASQGRSREEANQLSVMQELQADCYAGVWAHNAVQSGAIILEPGDVEEALNAASAIGDDRLQQQAQGHVVPESFTHGSSEQRARWFRRGLDTGNPNQCNTFEAAQL